MWLNRIRWKNLLSYGNYLTEVDFTKDDLTVIVGSNGSGKSTLLDALCFVLFGKAFRNINKPMLVNSITKKELEVEIDLTANGVGYRIVRGIKPAKFEIWLAIDGQNYVKQDMTGVRDEQAELEKILGCNFKSFTQVVCLGAGYEPFLKLEAKDRRKVVENLLDLEIFTDMNALLKEDYGTLVDGLKVLEGRRAVLRAKHATWAEAVQASEEVKQARIQGYQEEIAEHESEKTFKQQEIANLHFIEGSDYAEIVSNTTKTEQRIEYWHDKDVECDQHLTRTGTEVRFYEVHQTCPTCQQNIDPEFVKKMWADKNYHLERYKEAKVKIKGELQSADEMYRLYVERKRIQDNNVRTRTQHLSRIAILDAQIARAKSRIEEENTEHEVVKQEVIDELNKDLAELERIINLEFADKSRMTVIGKMLKDDGVKAVAISNYITFINELINKFLVEMDLFVNLYLDGEFNETIKSRYRDEFKYDSFSEGQKMRIDLAILFAWREIAKQRNSLSVNLLIFDEVLSGSLDAEGIVDLIKILRGRFQENIFLITHDDRISTQFNNIIDVKQVQSFSMMYRRSDKDDK